EIAVACQRREIDQHLLDVIQGMRPLGMARHLRLLPGLKIGVGLFKRRLRFHAKSRDFLPDRYAAFTLTESAQFLDLAFKLGNRFFEIEIGTHFVSRTLNLCWKPLQNA